MDNQELLSGHHWQPFAKYGFTHPFWTLELDTLYATIVVTVLIICLSLYAKKAAQKDGSVAQYLYLQYLQVFTDLLTQTLHHCPLNHLAFIGSLFTFIFLCNSICIIPYLEEPTKDLNTTLALGLISFFYVQTYAIKAHGIKAYIQELFEPFFVMFPLHIVGKLTSIISLSFRLFGNIFGGYIITSLYHKMMARSLIWQTFGLVSGLNVIMLIIFGVCEGLIQAFVFSMLTLTYLSIAVAHQEPEEIIV